MSFRGMWWKWNAWKWRLLDQEHCKCCMHKLIKMYKYTIQSNECTNKWMNGWMSEATLEWMSECLKDVRARLQYQYTCTGDIGFGAACLYLLLFSFFFKLRVHSSWFPYFRRLWMKNQCLGHKENVLNNIFALLRPAHVHVCIFNANLIF